MIKCLFLAAFLSFADSPNVIICGVCKNTGPYIEKIRSNVQRLIPHLAEYKVVIYENNSVDNTKTLLNDWSRTDPNVIVLSEDLTYEQLKEGTKAYGLTPFPFRTELIAKARNKVLDHIRGPQFSHYPYVIMVDLDFQRRWPIHEILRTIHSTAEWDCVTANGISKEGYYYDLYALRSPELPFGPELLGEVWWHRLPHFQFSGKQWIPVFSAFGGLAIYKRDKLLLATYSGIATDALTADYSKIQSEVRYAQEGDYFNCGAYGAPVVCEHVTLHAEMRAKGADKIFINPKLLMIHE